MKFTSLIKFNRSYFLKMLFLLLTGVSGCKKALDINQSPNALTTAPINTVLTNVTLNAGFLSGSDLHRFKFTGTTIWRPGRAQFADRTI